MNLIISKEAEEKIVNESPVSGEKYFPALKYSYRPFIEEEYHRSSDKPVSTTFSKIESISGGSRWDLVWYEKGDIPIETIYSSGNIDVALIGPLSKTAENIRISIKGGNFKVECS